MRTLKLFINMMLHGAGNGPSGILMGVRKKKDFMKMGKRKVLGQLGLRMAKKSM